MNVRDHIEKMMLNRLLNHNNHFVSEELFNQVTHDMDKMITNILGETNIPGFTDEDIKGLLYLKTHQILGKGQWDMQKRPFGFFSISYRNLIRDILRMRERAIRNGMTEDGLDECILFSEQKGQRDHWDKEDVDDWT